MRFLLFLLVITCQLSSYGQTQNWIAIPELLSGSTIDLDYHEDSVQFFPGLKTHTLGFNQYAYLGPTLVLNKGEDVTINVHNNMNDTTNLHWHGLHVSAINDGGPHTMVMNGETWSPNFTILNDAATYWYHPHFHGKTGKHVLRGAAGFIIVRDDAEALLELPRTYGIDDFPIVVQSIQYDSLNQPMPLGMQDSTIFVNGSRANYGYEANLNVPAQMVRLRLLNGSGERTFNFGFTNNMSFKIIGSDDGLLNAPVNATRVRVAPGERYEVILDLSSMQNETFALMSYASELPTGVQGGPTMEMGSGPPMDSPINGIDFNLLHFHVTAPTLNPVLGMPTSLNTIVPLQEASANITRPITMSAPSMMSMDGPFTFNNLSFDMDVINYHIPLNNIEIWQVSNQTMVAHPFHIHDVPFYILDRDGNLPPMHERGKKDVVLIQSMETVRFITKFETFADSLTPYVYHCHILMHEDAGMMGQFVVMPDATNSVEESNSSTSWGIFPNPTSEILNLKLPADCKLMNFQILDASGRIVYTNSNVTASQFDISQLSKGLYYVQITTSSFQSTKKLVVQ